MAKSAIAPDSREFPEYEFREFPKHLGFDAEGVDIEVADEEEEAERAGEVVYPKLLGRDRNNKPVIAMNPGEEVWKSKAVKVAEPAPAAPVAEPEQPQPANEQADPAPPSTDPAV